jgi:hypothetical protein
MTIISMLFWWIFEFMNGITGNWAYNNIPSLSATLRNLYGTIAFATVLPAFFETVELIRTIHLFDKAKLKKKHNITKHFIHAMLGIGILMFLLPLFFPKYFFR